MNNITPQRLALITSVLVAVISFLAFFIISELFYESVQWKVLILSHALLIFLSFWLYRFFLEKFIYQKIKLIYKAIHDLKATKEQKKQGYDYKGDIISQTNAEVMEWAKDKKKEIEDLQRLASYRRDFLGNVSHELKTPIFNIQGYVLTLLDGGLEDPEINRKYLLRCEQSIDRMISIIEDLEAISRLESGELKLKISSFDIVELAAEVMEMMEMRSGQKGIKLHFAQHYEPIFVHADRHLIQQVLTNLIVNSIKYGSENGTTKLSFFDMADNMLIEVTDSGSGIPREEIPRLFERFFRGDKSRTRKEGEGGSGLGLAIVKHILEAHAQTINVRSTLGVGSTFAFTLRKGGKQRHLVVF